MRDFPTPPKALLERDLIYFRNKKSDFEINRYYRISINFLTYLVKEFKSPRISERKESSIWKWGKVLTLLTALADHNLPP